MGLELQTYKALDKGPFVTERSTNGVRYRSVKNADWFFLGEKLDQVLGGCVRLIGRDAALQ